jgi:hypothetical protein
MIIVEAIAKCEKVYFKSFIIVKANAKWEEICLSEQLDYCEGECKVEGNLF